MVPSVDSFEEVNSILLTKLLFTATIITNLITCMYDIYVTHIVWVWVLRHSPKKVLKYPRFKHL